MIEFEIHSKNKEIEIPQVVNSSLVRMKNVHKSKKSAHLNF